MPQANPELIFLTGPQQGQRSVIMTSPVVAGRVGSCDLHLSEEFVSRQQFSLELTVDGWVMENLSVNGTRINGKKYKTGKRILLDSGDVLRMGRDTEILFVAPGDDPDAILAEYRSANPLQATAKQAPPPETETTPDRAKPEPTSPTPPPTPEEPDKEMTDEERLTRAKIRKYIVFGVVWGIGLIVLVTVLVMMSGGGGGLIKSTKPVKLLKRQIEDMLREDLHREKNLQEAAERLTKAVGRYGTGKWFRSGELQNCVKNFKLHLAYLGSPDFDDPKHKLMYRHARDKLIKQVQGGYREAWIREQDRQWVGADEGWQLLMRVIPRDPEWDTKGYDKLQRDIMTHASYARRYLRKR